MSIYVISDIHGQRNMFYEMLNKINFNENDHLYILGDVIDRGINGVKLLKELKNTPNITVLKGNHEHMCYNAMLSEKNRKIWFENGGNITFQEILKLDKKERHILLFYMNSLPLYKIITVNENKFVLVHAGLYKTNADTIEEMMKLQYPSDLLNIRELFLVEEFPFDCHIVFGHTITSTIQWKINGKLPDDYSYAIQKYLDRSRIWHSGNKIGIDCGAIWGGKLACIRLDDMEEFYVDYIKE